MDNFMCHNNTTITLKDRMNFISGQNGAGKSATLVALTTCRRTPSLAIHVATRHCGFALSLACIMPLHLLWPNHARGLKMTYPKHKMWCPHLIFPLDVVGASGKSTGRFDSLKEFVGEYREKTTVEVKSACLTETVAQR